MPPQTELLQGFAAVIGPQPRVLILGSMPGVASLDATQYYAHPRNRFWPVLAHLLGEGDIPTAYEERLTMLRDHGIALWDVLGRCLRDGSLDSAIDTATQEPNPIPELLQQHPSIRLVATNGGHASRTFAKAFPNLHDTRHLALPSTSPANARWSLEALQAAWEPITAYTRAR